MADPKAPGTSSGLTVLHHTGGVGTLAWGAPSQCFSRAGWAPRGWLMAAYVSRAGLISDNKVGRRAGVQGAILKSAVGGEKVRVPAVGRPGSLWGPAFLPGWGGWPPGGPWGRVGMPPMPDSGRRSRITLQISQVYPIHDITGC